MQTRCFHVALVLAAAVTVAHCQRATATEGQPPPSMAGAAQPPAAPATGTLGEVLLRYEAVRAALAADDLAAAKRAAADLAKAAHGAMDDHKTAMKELHLAAAQADKLAAATAIEAARTAFGEASRSILTVVAANPDATGGLFAFFCPMAKPYGKWLQREAQIANPYMGKRMLECGTTDTLKP